MSDEVVDWLLSGDPSVKWQTERDLLGVSEDEWEATRSLVARQGWGEALLDRQDETGTWSHGLYGPKWTSTTYTLLLLRRLGLPPDNPRAIAGCRRLLDDADWVDGGVSYWGTRRLAERCVNGMVLALVSYFDVEDERANDIAALLLQVPLADGGWNCRDHQGATHSSFNTTISVLEGLEGWKKRRETDKADGAIKAGQEFMLEHRLYRSHWTGEIIDENWTSFHFPPRWHYDVLRGLDHLQHSGADADPRAAEAIELVKEKRRPDGRWGKGSQYSGATFFALEPGRVAGRWNTLRAMRVLRWWEEASGD